MHDIYLLLGSNLGNPRANIRAAVEAITVAAGVPLACSPVYTTQPWGFEADNDFLNQAVKIRTDLSPDDLLECLAAIEKNLGRVRHSKIYESRPIDIDIIFYGSLIVDAPHLKVPHPRVQDRRFALVPLCSIAPDFIHPVFNLTLKELLERCKDTSAVNLVNK